MMWFRRRMRVSLHIVFCWRSTGTVRLNEQRPSIYGATGCRAVLPTEGAARGHFFWTELNLDRLFVVVCLRDVAVRGE